MNVLNVLVVDNDTQFRSVVVDLLENLGYRASAVAGGQAALRILDLPFNLVLTSSRMLFMTGEELAQQIQAQKGIPVIIMTSFLTEEEKLAITETGSFILMKPFGLEGLREAIIQATLPPPP